MNAIRQRDVSRRQEGSPVASKIRGSLYPAREESEPTHHDGCRVQARYRPEPRVSSERISTLKCQSRRRHHPVDPEMKRIQKLRTDLVRFMQCKNLLARIVSRPFVVELIGLSHGSAVKHIRAGERVLRRESMVNFCSEIIFGRDGLSCEGEYARVSCSRYARRKRAEQSSVWQRIESLEKSRNLRIHWIGCRRTAIGRRAEIPLPGCLRRNRIYLRDSLGLAQAFVVSKEECTILKNGPANRPTELIPMEGGLGRVEEIPGVECAVPEDRKSTRL